MRRSLLLLWVLPALAGAQEKAPVPSVAQGRIDRWTDFPSKFVAPRTVDVWLPPGYDGRSRCPVIYMQDGQMLFDGKATWNGKSWGIADAAGTLIREGKMPETIIVGIWSSGPQRFSEYFAEKALAFLKEPARGRFLTGSLQGRPQGDNYLRFMVQELKPAIDRKYATLADREHTIVMGSSMGAVLSLYALCEYPDVFGRAGCLSTHWTGFFERNASIPLALLEYLEGRVPDPRSHRIYFDHGTETLDALYAEPQALADLLFRKKGYGEGNFMSRVFPGAGHSEESWAQRVSVPLVFLSGH
jgi:enterochelin esterase-like enzyme